jgi:hypothetical protein
MFTSTGLSERSAERVVRFLEHLGSPPVVEVITEVNLVNFGLFLPPDILRRSVQTGIDLLRVSITGSMADNVSGRKQRPADVN